MPNIRRFLLDHNVRWPNLINGTGAHDYAKAYGVTEIPTNVLIGRDGNVIHLDLSRKNLEYGRRPSRSDPDDRSESTSSNLARSRRDRDCGSDEPGVQASGGGGRRRRIDRLGQRLVERQQEQVELSATRGVS